jgi:hypothetical protein
MHSTQIIFILIAAVFVASTTARIVDVELAVAEIEPFDREQCDLFSCRRTCRSIDRNRYKTSRCVDGRCQCFYKMDLDDMLGEVEDNFE